MIKWPKNEYWRNRVPVLHGVVDITISQLCSANNPKDHALVFVNSMSVACCEALMACKGCLIIAKRTDSDLCTKLYARHAILYADDPRYEFAEVLRPLWDNESMRGALAFDQVRGIYCGPNVRIDPDAVVEPGVTISKECTIGAGVYIMTGARLGPNVHVGRNTAIRENAVIGGWGFGFARAKGKPTIRIPHIGGVRIGSNVEIGALTTVCSGTIEPTIIEDGCIINDHSHIAHNCILHSNVVIGACADISGSVHIGSGTCIAPNCSIIDRIAIGQNVVVGIGAVVIRSISDGSTVVGNPAKALHK